MIETSDFKIVIDNIINEIQKTQLKMFQDENTNVLELYFHIGKIIDETILYHCGASINRIGYKTFSISLVGDNEVCKLLIDKVNKII